MAVFVRKYILAPGKAGVVCVMTEDTTEKDRWRQLFRQRRRRIFPRQRAWKSQKLVEHISGREIFKKSARILLFYPRGKEINPLGLVQCQTQQPVDWIFPRVKKETHGLEFFKVTDLQAEFGRGSYDLMEPLPEKTTEISPAEIDLAFVPGLIFDRAGYRLGYGGGYYDKLLSSEAKPVSVGLGYEFQKVNRVPRAEHDEAVDYLCTEAGLTESE